MLSRVLAMLCLVLVLPLEAQVLGSLPVRRYGTEQGLGSEVVSAMVQDPSGRLWVGTDAGICVFDGRRFIPFTGPLPSQSVLNLSVDLDGAIWVTTEGGLARIHRGQSRVFGEAEGIPAGRVEEAARDAEGHLWVLTSQGIRVEQAPHGFITPAPWPGGELPTHLFADPSLSGAWAITSRTIWHWKDHGWTRLEAPRLAPGEILQNVAVDGGGDLWVRSSNALWRLPAEGPRTWTGSRMGGGYSHISKLSRDTEGWVWLDNTEGLWRLRGDRREQFGHAQDDARGGMVDQEGGLWLRTDKGVLRVLGQARWRSYGRQDGLPAETCWQMVRDRSGRLWVGTDSGLWIVEGRRFKRLLPGRFLSLTLAKDDTLWTSGSPGGTVHLVDTRTLVAKSLRIDALPVARITAGLTIDAEGRPWVADVQGGLVRGRQTSTGWAWEPMLPDGSTPREVRGIFALPGGGVLLLHDRSASTWNQGTWRRIPDLLPDVPYFVAIAPDGRVAIGYRNRPVITTHRLEGQQLIRTTVLDLTASGRQLALYCMTFGDQGRLWIGTNNGLSYLDREDSSTFRILGAEDRLISPECNESAILAEPGRIWIGSPVGLMSHDPLPNPPNQVLRPPLLISARSGPQELDLFDSVPELSRATNELEVQFMVPNYQVQASIFYAARLSGVDADWVRLDTPSLRYAGLPAGPHTLELRGITQQGLVGPVTAFRFLVRPAWWEKAWVRVLGLLGLGCLVLLVVKVRQTQLEQRNRELIDEVARQTSALVAASKAKSAFLANMSHELRTPLNAILLYSEILQEDLQDPALAGLKKDAGKIQGAGRHLLGLIDDILDVSKIEAGHLRLDPQTFDLRAFLLDLDPTVRPLVEKNGNTFETDIRDVPDPFYSDPTRLRQILVNLLSNAAKFTQSGKVLLRAWSEGDCLLLMVRDSGIGMTQAQQARVFDEFEQADDSTARKFGGTGLGLTLVKKFTELLGGELRLDSQPGMGTTFIVKVPPSRSTQDLLPLVPLEET